MKYLLTLSLVFAFLLAASCRRTDEGQADVYVPKNLDEAHAQLLKNMPPEDIERIKNMKSEDEMIRYHFGAGMGIRNSWGLWHGSRLAKYFNDLGIRHADDMSELIMNTLWCRIHNQPFRLDERTKYYQAYWRANASPPETVTTPGGDEIDFRQSLGGTNSSGLPHAVHIGQCEKDGSFWAYEWNKGVYAPTGEMLNAIIEDDYWKETKPNKRLHRTSL
jgi:hypothetical protein